MTSIIDIAKVSKRIAYVGKDVAKFRGATKLISRGSSQSSSHAYAVAAGAFANPGVYQSDDVVGISAEGNRRGRIPPDTEELDKAVAAGVKAFITDTRIDRHRAYNFGERKVEAYLLRRGYQETGVTGYWTKE